MEVWDGGARGSPHQSTEKWEHHMGNHNGAEGNNRPLMLSILKKPLLKEETKKVDFFDAFSRW